MLRVFALTAGLILLLVPAAWTNDVRPDARSSPLVEEPVPDWPQWRGPNRDNVSPDRGLLKEWPKDGPPLAWKATDLGIGYSTVAIAGDGIFVTGDVGTETFLFALSREGGAKRWSVKLGDIPKIDHPGARSTPTVDGDRVYALTQTGDLRCLRVRDGAEVWHKNLVTDFGGRAPAWGYGESLLIDGDKVICTPGGKNALVALDKRTGAAVWLSDLKDDARHCSAVVSVVGGIRQYVQIVNGGVVGLDAKDGKLLWKYEKLANNTANGVTPVILGDQVFCTSGYSKGGALLTLSTTDGKFTATEQYYDVKLKNRLGGVVRVGDYIYGDLDANGQPWCLEWRTGKLQDNWLKNVPVRQGKGSISLTYADGHLYLRYDNGYVALVSATPDGYQEKGCFKIPNSTTTSYPHPVVIGGRLYLREKEMLWVYDVRAK